MIKSYQKREPHIHNTCLILDGAMIIGDVTLEEGVSIWFNSVIRADLDTITIGQYTNIQDLVMIHTDLNQPTIIGHHCTIGHQVILHGCKVGNESLIGMGTTILNGASIGNHCIIGANSLVTAHTIIPDYHLAYGNPAKVIRKLTDKEIKQIKENTHHYVQLSGTYNLKA